MDIALGVSMTPTTVRMVLVEGENADGVTVDHDVFDIGSDQPSATAPQQVVAAILGTRESAAEGGHRLVCTGVTWHDHDEASRLKEILTARRIDDVMLVSESHAAGALAQAVGRTVGYDRTALLFLDGDTATLSVVDTADGSIVRVERQDLHTDDAVARLTALVEKLDQLEAAPQGLFLVGSGVNVAALKPQLEAATSLPVSAPEEPGLALARGAALAATRAPLFEASTVGRTYAQSGDEATTAGSALAYSEVDDEVDALPLVDAADVPMDDAVAPAPRQRKPVLLVGSAMTSLFVLGVAALVVSLAVSIRPTVEQRPSPAESVIGPVDAPAAAPVVPAAPPAPAPETINAPVPVVQEAPAPMPEAPAQPVAPRTVFVEAPAPAPAAAPAPAPAAPAPAPAPAAPAPAPVPVAPPPVVAPAVVPPVSVPALVPQLPLIQWPWKPQTQAPQSQYPQSQYPQSQYPQSQYPQWEPPVQKQPQWDPPVQKQPQWDPPVQKQPQWDPPVQKQPKWDPPGRGGGNGGGGNGGSNGNGGNSQWPWPSWNGGGWGH